jgi:hypothetical protein
MLAATGADTRGREKQGWQVVQQRGAATPTSAVFLSWLLRLLSGFATLGDFTEMLRTTRAPGSWV